MKNGTTQTISRREFSRNDKGKGISRQNSAIDNAGGRKRMEIAFQRNKGKRSNPQLSP
jgi:hypothetical protein